MLDKQLKIYLITIRTVSLVVFTAVAIELNDTVDKVPENF